MKQALARGASAMGGNDRLCAVVCGAISNNDTGPVRAQKVWAGPGAFRMSVGSTVLNTPLLEQERRVKRGSEA